MGLIIGRILRAILWPVIRVVFPYRVIGKENKPKRGDGRGYVLCCNHISLLDPAFILVSQPRPVSFMAKKELFKNKIVGYGMSHWFGAFPVDRGAGDMSVITKSADIVKNGGILGIFPEGTRSKTGKLGRFKSGATMIAAKACADVIPVALVTKEQKVKAFRKTTIVYGKSLTAEELQLTGESPNLRYATRVLSETVASLMQEAKR